MQPVHYTVDGEPQSSDTHELQARDIVLRAGLDPNQRYLIELRGTNQESFKDRMTETVHLHENEKFITAFNGPVTVS